MPKDPLKIFHQGDYLSWKMLDVYLIKLKPIEPAYIFWAPERQHRHQKPSEQHLQSSEWSAHSHQQLPQKVMDPADYHEEYEVSLVLDNPERISIKTIQLLKDIFYVKLNLLKSLAPASFLLYLIERNIVLDHAPQAVYKSWESNSTGSITVTMRLISSPSKIK